MINCFDGKYGFLSNFCYSPIVYKGLSYQTAEAAYQSMKTNDMAIRLKFTKMSPGKAKQKGKQVLMRPDWDDVKDQFMYEIVKAKFMQNLNLKRLLLNTGDELLVEGNDWHDNHFGSCTCVLCFKKEKENILGKILM